MINAILDGAQIPSGLEGWRRGGVGPTCLLSFQLFINNDDDSHSYSFVISESFRLSASFPARYFICSHHNMQYLLSPLET